MKTILVVIACFFYAGLQAQEIITVLGNGNAKVSGASGTVSQKFSSIDNQFANL